MLITCSVDGQLFAHLPIPVACVSYSSGFLLSLLSICRDVMHIHCSYHVSHQMAHKQLAGGAGAVCPITMISWHGRRRQGTPPTSTTALPPASRSIVLSLRQSCQQYFRAAARTDPAVAQAVVRLSACRLQKEAETFCCGWQCHCSVQHNNECPHFRVIGVIFNHFL